MKRQTLETGRNHRDARLSEVPHAESGRRGHEGQRRKPSAGTLMAGKSVLRLPLSLVAHQSTPAVLRQNALDHVAVDVGQPVAAALKDRTVNGTFACDESVR